MYVYMHVLFISTMHELCECGLFVRAIHLSSVSTSDLANVLYNMCTWTRIFMHEHIPGASSKDDERALVERHSSVPVAGVREEHVVLV